MSEQQVVFDNWQDAAQQAEKQPQTVPQTQQVVTDQQKQKQQHTQQKKQQAKQTLKQKINVYQNTTLQQLQNKYKENVENGTNKKTLKLGVGKVFKTDKDFISFAEQIGQKLCQGVPQDQTLDQESLVTFFQELSLFLYNGLQWENFFEIMKKIKVLKNQRKEDQKRILKQKQRQRNKKIQEQSLANSSKIISEPTKKETDDLFGGVSNMTSLQQQQQRKQKNTQKKEQVKQVKQVKQAKQQPTKVQQQKSTPPPPPPAADDDDDFM